MGGAMGPALRLDDVESLGGQFSSVGVVARDLVFDDEPRAVELVSAPRAVNLKRSRGFYATKVKPAIDRFAAPFIALLVLPMCLAIALAVRVTMGKGVLFKQQRVGKDGELFEVVKFRTMNHDRRKRQEPIGITDRRKTHKSDQDPRHTPLGRFLRSTSLDELPQLLNVMRGEMSLIGPRPELAVLVDEYPEWQRTRHAVKPGMTGLWQVTARGEKDMQDCVDIDLDYVEQVSLWLDMRAAIATPVAALGKRRGA
jgi:lipopolysaccharide/colanic/teichoic acid biosynthesis glycosyltransferase